MKKKFFENISLKFRKNLMTSRLKTYLVMAILVVAFLIINILLNKFDLPKFDITENKIYSLSDQSIEEVKKIEQNVNIYVFGYEENSDVVDLIKQYVKYNDKLKYEIVTSESNPTIISKYQLQTGTQNVIIECGEAFKILSSYDFVSYDYSTYQQIDLTENALSNALLNLTISKKPKIYVIQGHNEPSIDQHFSRLFVYLQNQVFDYTTLNLLTVESIPEDCDLIAVLYPQDDLMENEVAVLEAYINNGGNMIFASDLLSDKYANQPNWQRVLDLYGLTVENGLIYEADSNSYVANSPLILFPKIEDSSITSTIKSEGSIIMEMPKRILLSDETKQEELSVSYEELLKSSENSYFITDLNKSPEANLASQEPASSVIAVKATKKVADANSEDPASAPKYSEAIVIANTSFISNVESAVAQGVTQVNLYNNADFFINSVANLTSREDTIKLRKETNSATFTPTETQDNIVLLVIFIVPIVIIITGIIVWRHRKHKC